MTFGLYSIVLLIAMFQGVVFAVLLVARRRNRGANRLLAALLLLFVLTLTPSAIGFAGAYERYPWLAFAPFTVTLGFGPLLWLYVRRLLAGTLPRRWALHLVPVAVQVVYYSSIFARPLAWREAFDEAVHRPYVEPAETFLALTSALLYWIAAYRLSLLYRRWAPARLSDSENYRLGWLRNFLLGTAIGFVVWTGFELVNATIRLLSYAAFFWLDLLAAFLLYGFAVAGYRHADLRWPAMTATEPATESTEPDEAAIPEPEPEPEPQWSELIEEIRSRVERERWYLDADLSLDDLARRLATNTWTLSRAINEGAGCNFNDFVNRFRVRAVQSRLGDPNEARTILEIALDCGFNSKTSFNRSFRKLAGETPTQCRTRLQQGSRS